MNTADLAPHAHQVLREATLPELPNHYRGKVRDNYDLPDGRRILITSDRISAFDRALAAIPFKGQVLTQTARYWFERTADLCPNHVLAYPDPNVVVGVITACSRRSFGRIPSGKRCPYISRSPAL
jgi:phosphoribosylaminoimidazole-succinocarboxamide synthase